MKTVLSVFVLFLSLTACHTTQKTSEFQQTKNSSQHYEQNNQQEAMLNASVTAKLNQTDELEGDFNQTITNYFNKIGSDSLSKPCIKSTIINTARWHRNSSKKENEKTNNTLLFKSKTDKHVSNSVSSVSQFKLDQITSPFSPWKWFLFGMMAVICLLFTWKISHTTFLP